MDLEALEAEQLAAGSAVRPTAAPGRPGGSARPAPRSARGVRRGEHRDRRAVAARRVEVAGDANAVAERDLRRNDLRADRHRERAARVEAAAGRRIAQVGRRAGDDVERPPVGVDVRERRRAASACTGGAARGRSRRTAPSSATRPAYMTRTRSQVSAMTDRSWVMRISDRPSSSPEVARGARGSAPGP